jgi:hypothetical protein
VLIEKYSITFASHKLFTFVSNNKIPHGNYCKF